MTEYTDRFGMTHRTVAQAQLTVKLGKGENLTVDCKLEQYGGNAAPHFSVTAEEWRMTFGNRTIRSCGCMHHDILRQWPKLRPLVALHLSDDQGVPMHGASNGWYWMAGALGGMAEQYHGGNSKIQHWKGEEGTGPKHREFDGYREPTPAECLRIFADHCRISMVEAENIRDRISEHLSSIRKPDGSLNFPPNYTDLKAATQTVKQLLMAEIDRMRPRWRAEALAGRKYIEDLKAKGYAGAEYDRSLAESWNPGKPKGKPGTDAEVDALGSLIVEVNPIR